MIGRAIRRAGEADHDFVVMDVTEDADQEGGAHANVTDTDAVMDAASGCDGIIHTAAMHGGSFGKQPNSEFIRVNVLGAENLFQAALEHGIRRLVISSSIEALVGRDWGAYGTAILTEDLPPRPDWIYPVTKVQVEVLGSFYARMHGLEVAQLRYTGVHDKPVEELGFGLLGRHVTANDVASANLAALTTPDLRDEIFHIGPDSPLTQQDVNLGLAGKPWEVLEKHWPGCREVLERHGKEPDCRFFWPVPRIDKAKLMLGWRPESRFTTYLRSLGWKE